LERTQQKKYECFCSLLGNKQRNNELAAVSAATVGMQ
jgi:hypothetical protein